MEGPRSPAESELPRVLNFLNQSLRSEAAWSIAAEYPTALSSTNLHNMRIITENDQVVSHAVLKPLVVKSPHVIFKVGAIGSVVTNETHRNQGLSTKIIEDCIQQATRQQCDIAILWTDLYDFYRRMGFELAGTEISVVVEEEFPMPDPTLRLSKDSKVAAEALHRLYSTHSVNSVRSVEETRKFLSIPQTQVYTAWDTSGQLAAYAVEGKGADLGGYIHEWGGSVTAIMTLLSYIRREKQQAVTIIIPRHSKNLLERLREKPVTYNQGFLGMIKILNFDQLAAKIKRAFRAEGIADIVLEKQNGQYVFGCNTDLAVLGGEENLTQLLFGPLDFETLDVFTPETREKLAKILPLNLWIWGWDSI
ncbi:GNAT family N-acetyltransferase [Bdellovibrio sp. HCB337]|uniref:GNAT family N-acetyltransferase n=1 Tax=Bdellovibrio sp. HCB337 TaxID=3394358 RepID=UPI0039A556D6